MKLFKYAALVSLFSLAFLSGCSTDDEKNVTAANMDSPVKSNIEISGGCQDISNDADKAQIKDAEGNIADIFSDFNNNNNLNRTQTLSSSTKESLKNVLKKNPNSCEAQVGFVATIISDIVNNKKINDILDTIYARKGKTRTSILARSVEDVAQMPLDFSINSTDEIRGILVSDVQSALASIIPSLDSAIAYMTNIANDESFTWSFTINNRTIELDRGDFAPALGALYLAKAMLTSWVSINLNFDDNGSYSWIDSLEQIGSTYNYTTNAGVKHVIKLLGKDSKFTSIHDSWKSEYKNIPNLLDSAITYVQFGLQYGLEEAKNGMLTQQNDLYIVGDGENAHLSTKDVQKVLDSLTSVKTRLRTGFDIPIANRTVKFVPYKWYSNTDGLLKFLPYHEINDMSIWDTPDGGFYWSSELAYQAYAQRYMQQVVAQSYNGFNPIPKHNEISGWNDDETSGTIHMEIYEPERIHAEIGYKAEGCNIKFIVRNYEVGYSSLSTIGGDQPTTSTDWTIPDATLPKGMCKEENGVAQYAVAYMENEVPNILYFTDASGKKTATIQELVNGKLEGERAVPYKVEELRSFIIFPDITFGGVFPDMTEDILWGEIIPEIAGENDDEGDYYNDNDDEFYL